MAIRLTPEELRSFASKLEGNSSEAVNLANQISQNINVCADSWEGNQKNKFVGEFEEIKPTLEKKLPALIKDMADTLKVIADNFERADNA